MKKRGKTGKKSKLFSKRKDSVSSEDEQVSVSSSLPPSVEGQIRCFLTLSVSKFTWAMEKHPDDVNIRIRWWGELGQGALLRPVRKAQERLTVESRWMSVRYPVCSGPKQFAAYLNDMGCLVVETVHASTHIPFGKALVSEITQLTASHPVNVVVPVMSVISPFNKLADIQVFIKFESISAAYNKVSSTIPTIDTGLEKENVDISNPDPTPPPYLNPATPVTHPKHQRDANDPFESPANPIKGVKFSEDPPQRLEYSLDPSLLFLGDNDLKMSEHITSSNRQLHNPSEINRELDLSQQAFISGNEANLTNQNHSMPASHENGQNLGDKTTMDWIGALLEKGQKLRDGLALSALLDDTSATMNEEHSPPESHVLPGHLFQAILSPEKTSSHQLQLLDSSNEQIVGDGDMVVNLLMGDNSGIDLLSDISEDLSEIGDPLHDDSLLMDLFYKQDDKSGGNESDGTISTDEEDNHPVNISMNDGDKSGGNESDVRVSADEEDNHPVNIPMNDGEKEIKVKQFMKDNLKSEELIKRYNSTEEDSDRLDWQQETEVHTEEMSPRDSNDMIHKLGTDKLTTLGRVNTARVVIEKLQLTDPKVVKRQNSSKKQSTFFLEYHFPISTRDATGKVSVVRELTRAASKKLLNDVVTFNHRSVFPVSFNASVLEQCWGLNLIFRVLKRQSIQKVPEELGVGVLPLKTVLLSKNLSHASLIEVMEHSNKMKLDTVSLSSWQKAEEESLHSNIIGNIEVKVELGLDGKQLLCQTSSTSSTDSVTCPQQIQSNVVMVSQPSAVIKSGTKHAIQLDTHRDAMNIVISKPPLPKQSQSHVIKLHEPEEPADMLTLYSLLWIPEGKGISSQVADNSRRTGNLFLVSRMFWCDEVSKSPIYWGITNNPHLGYKQVAPVLLTPTLLQRTCNNFMVIEVWNKAVPQGEMLIGITKLPLHQFYLSFRDSKITKTLIKSKFPVICVDELIPIINPFTTQSHGELKVLLAMGTQEQIAYLLEIKGGGQTSSVLHNKEIHHLDRNREQRNTNAMHSLKKNFSIVEHQFEITVEDIRGLSIFKSTIWGETDCYVQYHFPSQVKNSDVLDNEVVPDLKSYHTCTTLCVPDPSFQDTTRHSFVLPSGVPVQRYLLAAYSGSWMNVSSIPGSGGVPFELWRRYYYPNVRDQLVAKASLPVAKLCAMVTMKRQREPSIQTFSLPLTVLPEEDKATEHNMIEESGLLNVAIKYQENKIHSTDDKPKLDSNQVCLSVDIIRICGLKDAAKLHATATPSMSYPADVGVNTYVVIKLPIGKKAQHVTRTVARTFAPEFSYHIEIGAPLQMSRKPSERSIISLAEKLEMSEAVFEIWHQDCRGFGAIQEQQDKPHQTKPNKYDVFMGVVKVPLAELVTHRTGIRGWHPIKPAIANHHDDDTVLGGLQLSIKFEDPEDRENVIHAGRNLGWSPPLGVDDDEELKGLDVEDEDDDSGQTSKGLELSVKMDRALVSRSLIDDLKGLPDQSHLDIKGYVRYKLYDKSPICSGMVCIRPSEKNMFLLDIKHSRSFVIPVTSSLLWYLREEKLEVQVWLRGQAKQSKEIATLPGQRDKLIGSAFINLSALVSKGLSYQSQTSGTFPLFKAGAGTIDGACVCVQISLATPTARSHNYDKVGEYITVDHSISSDDYPSTKGYDDDDDDDDDNDKSSTGTKTIDKGHNLKTKSCMDDVDTFAAHIIIQEARHLNSVAGPGSQRVSPNAYVTYQISPSTLEVTTPVYQSSFRPLWEYQKLERLPSFILKTQNLIFKVWHKAENNENHRNSGSTPASGDDVALGFASVDLKPLAAGLRQLIGWYNIMDFSGECKGQIKVGVVPLTPVVSSSHCLPKSRIHTGSSLTTINKVPVPFYTDNKEWQEQFQADDLVSVQKHSHSESLLRIGSVDISPLTEEINTTRPVTTSTSLLFKQLRENMKDLDDLQKRFQAKLCACSSGAGVIGELHFSEGMSSRMKLHAQQIPDDNDNLKSFNFNMKDLEREEQLLQYRKQTLDASEASSPFGKCGEGYKIVREKPSTSNENLFEKIPQLGQIVTKKEDLSSHHPSSNSDKEAINEALINAAVEDTLTELVEVTNSSQDHDHHMLVTTGKETSEKLCTPSESDLEEYMGADSIEDSTYHETKIECPSEPGFMQERDSWLSSPEEDETEKFPLNSTDYSLNSGNQYRTDEEESDGKRETSNKSYKLSVVTVNSSSEGYKDQTFKEEHEEINKHPLKACLHKGDSDCMQKDCFGETENEQLQTSGYEISNSIPCTQKDNKLSYLPNFFMPTQQLENSMRALRLGTKVIASSTLHDHPQSRLLQRTFDTKSRGTGSNRIMNQFSQKKTIYKAKKDGHPPLSAAEIERIARIFSSKDA